MRYPGNLTHRSEKAKRLIQADGYFEPIRLGKEKAMDDSIHSTRQADQTAKPFRSIKGFSICAITEQDRAIRDFLTRSRSTPFVHQPTSVGLDGQYSIDRGIIFSINSNPSNANDSDGLREVFLGMEV